MRRAFTLIELLVVIAMLAILIGVVGSGMNKARRRAQIAKATQDVKEITNAILAFENYAPDRTFARAPVPKDSWVVADENSLKIILGGLSAEGGGTVPVLYRAQLSGDGKMLDPWGKPYKFIIKKADDINPQTRNEFYTAFNLPNFYRLSDDERKYKGEDE